MHLKTLLIILICWILITNIFTATKNNNIKEIVFSVSFSNPSIKNKTVIVREASNYYLNPWNPVLPVYIKVSLWDED